MKKILFMSFLAGSFALTGCDPVQEEVDNNTVQSSAEDILSGITFTQYSDAEYTTPAADGNYIFYQTNPGRQIQVYNKFADGSMNLLAAGASGKFSIKPKRGSDSNQPVYIRALNSDGSVTTTETSLNVFVQQELDPEMRLLASDAYGTKTWKWDPTICDNGEVWGNMGYCGGKGSDVGTFGNGKWWGVTSTDDFNGQLQHSHNGANNGDGDLNAYMVFSDEGIATTYDANGNVIRTGTFSVANFDPSDPDAWKVGDLVTTAILWPYEINSNGNIPGTYEICYLTPDKMTLVYPDGGAYDGLGNWGEATFWHFCSTSDLEGMAIGYGKTASKDWTWDYDGTNTVWGNMGYCGGDGTTVGTEHNGQWWGCASEEDFAGQLQHSNTGALNGDEGPDAYFTLSNEGTITRHAADGSVINSGTFEIVPIENNSWKMADLNTTAGTILWPFEINSNGNMPTTFEVVYLTNNKMCLVYPDGGDFGGLGNWGEATYWHFKAK